MIHWSCRFLTFSQGACSSMKLKPKFHSSSVLSGSGFPSSFPRRWPHELGGLGHRKAHGGDYGCSAGQLKEARHANLPSPYVLKQQPQQPYTLDIAVLKQLRTSASANRQLLCEDKDPPYPLHAYAKPNLEEQSVCATNSRT